MNDLLKRLNMKEISPYFDECYEKIKYNTSIPNWLTEEYIEEIIIKKYDLLPKKLEEYDFSTLPEESSLQKKLKDHYLSWKILHETNGIYPY